MTSRNWSLVSILCFFPLSWLVAAPILKFESIVNDLEKDPVLSDSTENKFRESAKADQLTAEISSIQNEKFTVFQLDPKKISLKLTGAINELTGKFDAIENKLKIAKEVRTPSKQLVRIGDWQGLAEPIRQDLHLLKAKLESGTNSTEGESESLALLNSKLKELFKSLGYTSNGLKWFAVDIDRELYKMNLLTVIHTQPLNPPSEQLSDPSAILDDLKLLKDRLLKGYPVAQEAVRNRVAAYFSDVALTEKMIELGKADKTFAKSEQRFGNLKNLKSLTKNITLWQNQAPASYKAFFENPRKYLSEIQSTSELFNLDCSQFPKLSHKDNMNQIQNKWILLDPGHLGGQFSSDQRNICFEEDDEKGKPQCGYREGKDVYIIAQLVRQVLISCYGFSAERVLLTRRGLHDVGGLVTDSKDTLQFNQEVSSTFLAYENLPLRMFLIDQIKADIALSLHTDNTPHENGKFIQISTIMNPRPPSDPSTIFLKTPDFYQRTTKFNNGIVKGFNNELFAAQKEAKACKELIGFDENSARIIHQDIHIFRAMNAPFVSLVELYSHRPASIRANLNSMLNSNSLNREQASIVIKQNKAPDMLNLSSNEAVLEFNLHPIQVCAARAVLSGLINTLLNSK